MPDDPKPAPNSAAVAAAAAHIESQVDEAQAAIEAGDAKTAALIKKELDAWLTELPKPIKTALAETFASVVADVAELRKEIREALSKLSTQAPPSNNPPPNPTPPSTNVDDAPASGTPPANPEPKPVVPVAPEKKQLRKL